MRKPLLASLFALAWLIHAAPASAQNNWVTPGGSEVDGKVIMCLNSSGQAVPVSNGTCANPEQTTATIAAGQKVGIDQTTDVTTNGVEIAPTAGAAAGIAPVVSASAEGTHVFKASAGNLYSAYVTTGATAGFFMIFDATSAPGDGAVTPKQCVQAAANQTTSISFNPGPPEAYATGISAAFSTTGCFTKTASGTAFFHGSVK